MSVMTEEEKRRALQRAEGFEPNLAELNVVQMKQPPTEIEAAGESLRRNEAAMVENAKIVARLRRASYLAYRDAGFTAEEALTLCTK